MDKSDIWYLRIGYPVIAVFFLAPILTLIYLSIAFICNSFDAFSWHWVAKAIFVLISMANIKVFASMTIKQYYIAKGKLNDKTN